ncbi:MAG TPA: zinc-dependent alcohol dehydrogenase family protein [Actinomycetes bacterium]|jgi:propanol-preferring alcohol dehydrogenase|nr:zinc-dependent alcohol dehydrogenase family protein [Actinomycetes bacterium]
MRAWVVQRPGPATGHPLALIERAIPEPGPGQVRVRVSTCGVCRTDLHLAEGDLPPKHPQVVPGHEVVGRVDALGPATSRFRPGERIGVAWLGSTDMTCRFCRRGAENLCLGPRFTGWDQDGGYAEYLLVREDYAYALPDAFSDEQAAPLLCAGIIGYRALRQAALPPAGRLGIFGFGGSAHLVAQVALAEGAEVHVFTRSAKARALATSLGVASAGASPQGPNLALDSALLFAPAGSLIPVALEALDRGGTLAVAGIYVDEVPRLDYERALFQEKRLRSVTANTRVDGEEFLAIAARVGVHATTVPYRFEEADKALADLAQGRFTGAAVLKIAAP